MSQFRKNQNQEGTYKVEQTIKKEIPLNQGSTMGSQSMQSGGSTMNTIPTTFSTTTMPTNDTYGITEPYISSTVLPTTQSCNVCEQSKNQCNVHNTTSNVSNTSTSTSTHHGEKVKEDKSHHKSHFPANIFHYHHGYDDRRGETWNETNMEKKVVNDQPMQQQPIQMQQQPMQQGMMSTNTNNTNTDGTTYYSKNTVLGDNNPSRLDNPNSIPTYEDTSLTRTAIPTSTMQNQSMTNQMPMHQPMQSTMQMNQQPMQPSMQMHQQNVMGVPVETVSMLEGSSFVPSGTPQGQYETGFKKQNDHNYHLRKKNHEPESTGPWQENLPSKNKPKYVVRKDD